MIYIHSCLYNIMSDAVLQAHMSEEMARCTTTTTSISSIPFIIAPPPKLRRKRKLLKVTSLPLTNNNNTTTTISNNNKNQKKVFFVRILIAPPAHKHLHLHQRFSNQQKAARLVLLCHWLIALYGKNFLGVARIAQHLDRCMGISGRRRSGRGPLVNQQQQQKQHQQLIDDAGGGGGEGLKRKGITVDRLLPEEEEQEEAESPARIRKQKKKKPKKKTKRKQIATAEISPDFSHFTSGDDADDNDDEEESAYGEKRQKERKRNIKTTTIPSAITAAALAVALGEEVI